MEFMVLCSAVLCCLLVLLLGAPAGRRADRKRRRLDTVERKFAEPLSEDLGEAYYSRVQAPRVRAASVLLRRFLPKSGDKNGRNEVLEKQLRLAGIYISAPEYSFFKIMVSVLLFGGAALLAWRARAPGMVRFLVVMGGAMLAVLVPNYYLKAKITTRQNRIRQQLPEVLDLLAVCVEAGLSFDNALVRIAERMKGPFVDELLILHREIQLGRPRREALRNLSEGSSIQELKTFASSLAQAEQLGIPVNNVMKVQASQLRLTRRQNAQEKGMKAPVKMMLPMVAFVFPVIFIILLGPTVIQLMKQFG